MQPAVTILVVDDDEGFVDLLHFGLKRAGFAVLQAYAGRHALDVIRTERPDLVVLDVRLPDMSGFAVLSALRACTNVPVIMLTGYDRGQDLRSGHVESPDDYVTKPFSIQAFVQRVETVLQRAVRPVNRAESAVGAVG